MDPLVRVAKELGQCEDPFFHNMVVVRRLGRGGFAEVFECKNGEKSYAVKRWDATAVEGAGGIQVFMREVNCMKDLDHPNVVKLYGYTVEPSPMIALEYVDGWNLLELIHSDFPYNLRFVVDVCTQITAALKYVHEKGIMHRDLKSDNIMIACDEQTGELVSKLCDFGLSRSVQEHGRPTGLRGTPYWTAPEVIRGDHYTQSADIYSFGITLWELCTRMLPYSEEPAAYTGQAINVQLLQDIVQKERRPLLPAWLKDGDVLGSLIEASTADDVTSRPTLDHALAMLHAASQDEDRLEKPLEHVLTECCCQGRINAIAATGVAGGRRDSFSVASSAAAIRINTPLMSRGLRTVVGAMGVSMKRQTSAGSLKSPGSSPNLTSHKELP